MIDAELIPWLFGAIFVTGATFLLVTVFAGGFADADIDFDMDMDVDVDLDATDTDGTESSRVGCLAIAAFMTGFGAVGTVLALTALPVALAVILALAAGVLFGRTVQGVLGYVMRQQSNALIKTGSLEGKLARITVNTPAGQTGEAMLEAETRMKYPVCAVDTTVTLQKGEMVRVVEVKNGRLYVVQE